MKFTDVLNGTISEEEYDHYKENQIAIDPEDDWDDEELDDFDCLED